MKLTRRGAEELAPRRSIAHKEAEGDNDNIVVLQIQNRLFFVLFVRSVDVLLTDKLIHLAT